MNPDNLSHLSISELKQIQTCVSIAVEKKTTCDYQTAKQAVLALLEEYSQVDSLKLLQEIAEDLQTPVPCETEKSLPETSHSALENLTLSSTIYKLTSYVENLQDKCAEIANKQDGRLLWLTNAGIQKVSTIGGAALIEVLQTAICQIEELVTTAPDRTAATLEAELEKIQDCFSAQTGIALINGIFAVIEPIYPSSQTPLTVLDMTSAMVPEQQSSSLPSSATEAQSYQATLQLPVMLSRHQQRRGT